MHLPVHHLALVLVIADVGEVGFLLAVVNERTAPQDLFFGPGAQVGELLIVLAAHLAVDPEKAREQVRAGRQRAVRIDIVDQLVHESVVQHEIALAELLGKELEPEAAGGLGTHLVAGVNHRCQGRRQVPGIGKHGEPAACVLAGQGETAERVRTHSGAGFVPGPAGGEGDQLHAGLVDVVLEIVGNHAGRRQNHVHLGFGGVGTTV